MPHPIFPHIVTIIMLSCSASQITEKNSCKGSRLELGHCGWCMPGTQLSDGKQCLILRTDESLNLHKKKTGWKAKSPSGKVSCLVHRWLNEEYQCRG